MANMCQISSRVTHNVCSNYLLSTIKSASNISFGRVEFFKVDNYTDTIYTLHHISFIDDNKTNYCIVATEQAL